MAHPRSPRITWSCCSGVEPISARNSAGYDAPIGLTADPVVFTLVGERLSVLLARRLEDPQRGMFALPGRVRRGGGGARADRGAQAAGEDGRRLRPPRAAAHLRRRRGATRAAGCRPSPTSRSCARRSCPGDGPAEREASWHPVDELPELALDHERIVDDGLWRLRARVAEKTWFVRVAGALLPPAFPLGQAQRLYEALRGEAVDAANFRRDIKATGLLVDTGAVHSDGPGRPGRIYRRL